MQDFDNMPMRESMRDSHKQENKSLALDDYPPVNEDFKKNCRVIDRKLKRSIDQNYDNIYSWLCNKYKANPDFGYLKSYFLDQFRETAQDSNREEKVLYVLDENKKINRIE